MAIHESRPRSFVHLCTALLALVLVHAASAQMGPERARRNEGVKRVVVEVAASDHERRVLSESDYDPDGYPRESIVYARRADGALLRTTVSRYGPGGVLLLRETLDAEGAVAQQTLTRLDERERLLEQITYDADGAVVSSTMWQYDDEANRATREVVRGATLVSTGDVDLGPDGTPTAGRDYDADGVLLATFERDPATGVMEEVHFRDGAPALVRSMRFDEALGELVELTELDPEGTVVNEMRRTFDEMGRLVEEVRRSPGPSGLETSVTRFEYDDDERGSWVVRRRYENGDELVQTTYATIEYY